MAKYSDYDLQLYDAAFGVIGPGSAIISSGGKVYVATAGDAAKATIYNPDSDYASLTNPLTPTRGRIRFATLASVTSVDLYIQAPNGQFRVIRGVTPGGPQDVVIDSRDVETVMVIPFAIGDTAAATETDTGFDLPTNAAVRPWGLGVLTLTLDATEDIDVGILSTESGGDADGIMDGVSVNAAGFVPAKATVTSGTSDTYFASTTYGALVRDFLAGSDTNGDSGMHNLKSHVCDGTAKSISYTLSAGTDTAEGFIVIPLTLANAITA